MVLSVTTALLFQSFFNQLRRRKRFVLNKKSIDKTIFLRPEKKCSSFLILIKKKVELTENLNLDYIPLS